MNLKKLYDQLTRIPMRTKIVIVPLLIVWGIVCMGLFADSFFFFSPERSDHTIDITSGTYTPVIALDPASGSVGTSVTVRGEGWPAGSLVLIYLIAPDEKETMFNQPQAYGDLIEALQSFCQEELGRAPRRIRVDLDNNMALILLEQFLSPAETEAAQQGEEAEKTCAERLQHVLKPRFQLMVEEATKQRVARAQVYIDFPVGNVIGVFVYTENLAGRDG